jgi:hypothetical protein
VRVSALASQFIPPKYRVSVDVWSSKSAVKVMASFADRKIEAYSGPKELGAADSLGG